MFEVIIYPAEYESARTWLLVHSAYAIVSSFFAALEPKLVFGLMDPLLVTIELYTGLAHFSPETPETRNALVTALAFSIGIGSMYFLYGGPWWRYGGKVLVEGSMLSRLLYALSCYACCFLTPHGSSLLFLIASIDIVSILLLMVVIGSSWKQFVLGRAQVVRLPKKQS